VSDPYDLSNHFPLGPEDGIEENGYLLKAWQPANAAAPQELVVQALKDGELVRYVTVPMNYPNIFGVDIADMAAVERATDGLLRGLVSS
jgi:hypothetical protein